MLQVQAHRRSKTFQSEGDWISEAQQRSPSTVCQQYGLRHSGWFRHIQHVRPNRSPTKTGPFTKLLFWPTLYVCVFVISRFIGFSRRHSHTHTQRGTNTQTDRQTDRQTDASIGNTRLRHSPAWCFRVAKTGIAY